MPRTHLPDTCTKALGKHHWTVSPIAVQQDEYAAAIPMTPSELDESLEATRLHEIVAAMSILWSRYLPLRLPEA
ncbi:MAG: hypothetical protein JOZ62_14065 [Acidobacteriaceae bacterium]|nr:hypothetical protein [Acidobacteriaceae bacterium]